MNSTPLSIVRLMDRVLGDVFAGPSWRTWRLLLATIFEPQTVPAWQQAMLVPITQRRRMPAAIRELWIIVGRRAGKSIIAALIAVWATCCRSYTLKPGEVGVFMVIAADRRQARVVKRYIAGLLRAAAVLRALVDRETKDAVWLKNGLCIEIHTCSFRSLRGYTCIGSICDELAFWQDEDSANPDHEVLVALRAAMATVPEALLLALTSPYARRGEAWRTYQRHFGQDASDHVLVVNAPTLTMNPTVEQSVIDGAYEDDPIAAAAEYGGEWRRDVEAFLPVATLDAVSVSGRLELPPDPRFRYAAFVDPAGGTGKDSFTVAIGHTEMRSGRPVAVLDVVRERRPPFSPESVVQEFAETLRAFRVTRVRGDRYAGEWPREAFRKCGIVYEPSTEAKSDIYLTFLPLMTSGRVELLDLPRLRKQLGDLERRTARGGRDSIDHPPRGHDDLANVVAGVLVDSAEPPSTARMFSIYTGRPIEERAGPYDFGPISRPDFRPWRGGYQ